MPDTMRLLNVPKVKTSLLCDRLFIFVFCCFFVNIDMMMPRAKIIRPVGDQVLTCLNMSQHSRTQRQEIMLHGEKHL